MNKQQLAAKIWESANKLRSKIEANEYKDYILGFIFYKFLSDKEEQLLRKDGWGDEDLKELTEDEKDTVNSCRDSLGYFIAYDNLFSTWLKLGKDFDVSNVTDALSAFNRLIAPKHKKVFDKIFNTLETGLSKLGDTSGTYLQGGQGNLSGTIVTSLIVDCPDYNEQKKVGNFFDSLENLIAFHRRKYNVLVRTKKAMLQKMFPRNGAKVPEIRFAGFSGTWEQRKVGDVTTELTEYATLSSGLPLLTSSRAGIMYQTDYRGNATTDNQGTLFSVVPIGACTYRHMSDDDIFHLNYNILCKGLVSREYPVFIASGGNNLSFIIQHLNSSPAFAAFCKEQKKGGTRTRLYYNTLCNHRMMIAPADEQKKIADYFSGFDNLITLHQRKYEILKHLKQSLLQKMFI